MRIDRLYIPVFFLGTTVFLLAFGTGLFESFRTERRLPGLAIDYGKDIPGLFQKKDYKQAIDQLQLALQFSPPDRHALYYNLGLVFSSQGNLVEAAANFERALAIAPNLSAAASAAAKAHFDLGIMLMNQGNPAAAAAQFQQALRFNPEYAEAFTMLQRLREQNENRD